jgi:hypothetical protein
MGGAADRSSSGTARLREFAHRPLELKFCCGMHQRQRRKPAKRSGTAGRQRAKKKMRIIK